MGVIHWLARACDQRSTLCCVILRLADLQSGEALKIAQGKIINRFDFACDLTLSCAGGSGRSVAQPAGSLCFVYLSYIFYLITTYSIISVPLINCFLHHFNTYRSILLG